MAAMNYPKELSHPNGFRTVSVYSAEEEKAALEGFAEYRRENERDHLAAVEGKSLSARRGG